MYPDFPIDEDDDYDEEEEDYPVTVENADDDDFSDIGEDEMEDLEDEIFDLGF